MSESISVIDQAERVPEPVRKEIIRQWVSQNNSRAGRAKNPRKGAGSWTPEQRQAMARRMNEAKAAKREAAKAIAGGRK